MSNLIGKTISAVDFVDYAAGESGPDTCASITISFSDGTELRLVAESSQDMGYIEMGMGS